MFGILRFAFVCKNIGKKKCDSNGDEQIDFALHGRAGSAKQRASVLVSRAYAGHFAVFDTRPIFKYLHRAIECNSSTITGNLMRILVVEDEEKVARFIRKGLEAEGYEVEIASDGKAGEKMARTESHDLILLDVLLPKKDGFEIVRDLRRDEIRTPVLMLTARSNAEDVVNGLDQGADDYLTKPFAFSELLARMRSLIRRGAVKTRLKYSDLILDTVAHKAQRAGRPIDLTTREYALLEYFMRNRGRLITREELAKEIWGYTFDPGTNVVDVYVNHLRKKIDVDSEQKLLQTERGRGYYLAEKRMTFKAR
jgi:DNA-binding response OmpR family regulator